MSARCPPKRNDGIPNELLYNPAVAGDNGTDGIEVAKQKLSDVFRIPVLGEWCEANQVHEQHRADPAFRTWEALGCNQGRQFGGGRRSVGGDGQ
jgi:hypothetical protein